MFTPAFHPSAVVSDTPTKPCTYHAIGGFCSHECGPCDARMNLRSEIVVARAEAREVIAIRRLMAAPVRVG